MRCTKCNFDNLDAAKYCIECGTQLVNRCAKCGAENPARAKFCIECGAALGASSPASAPEAGTTDPHKANEGERRHLTVLFCDLVNSTAIAAHLDPEEWRDIAAQYQRGAADAVTRFGGYVAKYLGDGLVAYFGYPEAHEDDPERAIRAGLAIIEATAALNNRAAGKSQATLAVRVGIDSGSVVIGRGGGGDAEIFGDVPNIAARVQAEAEADTVLITAAVHKLVSGSFIVEDRGAHSLKGFDHPMQLYRAVEPSIVRQRRHSFGVRGMTPFVGREDELRLLLSRWERTRQGQGQVVLVMGEPGIGKSRLIEEFRAKIKNEPHLWIECAGEQFFETTPFHTVAQMLDHGLGWSSGESTEQRAALLERSIELAGLKVNEALPLVTEMLNLPVPEKFPPLTLSPDQRRKRLLAALAGWVLGATTAQPIVVAMEDLHWVDPSTLELTQMLVEQGATAPLMLLYTARPEYQPSWPMRAHHAQITLSRLDDRNTREMVSAVAARSAMAKDLIDAVVKRTDGVPLFAEELTRLMLEGDGHSRGHEIPATLHDSLAARLDRLGAAREVAQVAAVIGREFSYELLHAVSPIDEQALQAGLKKLADAELIYARGVPPEAAYKFKHALIQDTAYEALLKTRRRELHGRVARTIIDKFPALAEDQPQTLARHWTGAGETEPAIAAWRKAARVADSRRAFKEAVEDYQQALTILKTLPETADRDQHELRLLSELVRVINLTSGWTSPHTVEVIDQYRQMAEKTNNLGQVVLQRAAAWAVAVTAGDFPTAVALADQTMEMALREGSATSLAFARYAKLTMCYLQGDLAACDDHFAQLEALGEVRRFRQMPGSFAIAYQFASWNAWAMGRADQARGRLGKALAFALETGNPFDLAYARNCEATLHHWMRNPEMAEKAATEELKISTEHSFGLLISSARVLLGAARAALGKTGEGVSLIRQGLSTGLEAGQRVNLNIYLYDLAQAQMLDGALDDALGTIEDALKESQVKPLMPHSLTSRGEIRLKLGQNALAEADFREAISLARQMGAKGLELYAALPLARMLAAGARRDEARVLLADLYAQFSEGFDTRILIEAKTLLDDLR